MLTNTQSPAVGWRKTSNQRFYQDQNI
jgi:hypothetical protein